jgi:signal transduction histidine kinase
MRVILITCGITLFLTCAAFFGYQYLNFRQSYLSQLSKTGHIIASNSTAALAFESYDDANEILASLKADPHIIGACLYDAQGRIFAKYPPGLTDASFPGSAGSEGYRSGSSIFEGFQPVVQEDKRLGTLYLRTDNKAMYELFYYYSVIALGVFAFSLFVGFLISKQLQQAITKPILALAETSRAISQNRDYSVRATKISNDESGLLTDAFNQMLAQIDEQNTEILSLNQNLEDKIKERTSQLQEVNNELEAFSYSVSHDLRAPLRAISGHASILERKYESAIDGEGKRLLERMKYNAARMGTLIDDLLAFARLGRLEIEKTKVPMRVLFGQVLTELNRNTEHNAEVRIHELLPAYADFSLMEHVITNLLSNAIKYSSKKKNPMVEVRSERKNGEIIYCVSDNGAGFDMQYANKLFGVFQRLHTADEFTGTGVGLAIVQRIINKHGGNVWAEGKVGEGATFYFSLPDIK